jgi:hypothetical protein
MSVNRVVPRLEGLSFAIVCLGILFLYIFAMFEARSLANPSGPNQPSASSVGATLPPGRSTGAAAGVRLPEDAASNISNEVTEDQKALRNILVAIPVMVTALVAFAPFAIRNFVDNAVREALDKRIEEANKALVEARNQVKEAQDTLKSASEELKWRLQALESFICVRMAYLHWNQNDPELALHYVRRGLDGLDRALGSIPSDHPDLTRMKEFRSDALDGCAYYAADLRRASAKSGLTDEETVAARERALEMLSQLSLDGNTGVDLIERVDTCLFIVWCLRDYLEQRCIRQASDLFQRWRTPLENHAWKRRQRENYELYKAWYDEFFVPAV